MANRSTRARTYVSVMGQITRTQRRGTGGFQVQLLLIEKLIKHEPRGSLSCVLVNINTNKTPKNYSILIRRRRVVLWRMVCLSVWSAPYLIRGAKADYIFIISKQRRCVGGLAGASLLFLSCFINPPSTPACSLVTYFVVTREELISLIEHDMFYVLWLWNIIRRKLF